MNKRIAVLSTGFLLGTAGFAAGCGSGSGTAPVPGLVTVLPTPAPSTSPTPPASPTPAPVDGPVSVTTRYQNLVVTLSTPRHIYPAGEVAPITLTVENTGSADVSANDALFFAEQAAQTSPDALPDAAATQFTRLFSNGMVFPAGQIVSASLNYRLTTINGLRYRTIRIFVADASAPLTLTAPGDNIPHTDPIVFTVQ